MNQRSSWRYLLAIAAIGGCGARSDVAEVMRQRSPEADLDLAVIQDSASPDSSSILDPRCPRDIPEIGESCQPVPLRCSYERCMTAGKADVTFLCVNDGAWFWEGRWDCEPNPAGCPDELPADLSPCGIPDAVCRWAPGVKASCRSSDRRWHLWHGF